MCVLLCVTDSSTALLLLLLWEEENNWHDNGGDVIYLSNKCFFFKNIKSIVYYIISKLNYKHKPLNTFLLEKHYCPLVVTITGSSKI